MTIESMVGLALATLVFSALPGPGIMAVVAQSLAKGFGHGARFTAGLVLGDMLYLFLAMFGMGFIASRLGGCFVVLKWAGGGYLVWLGLSCFRQKPPVSDDYPEKAIKVPTSGARAFAAGLCVTLGNPKVIAFYCGFLPGFVTMETLGPLAMIQVVSITLPIVFFVPLGYAWLAARGRRAVRSTHIRRITSRAAGCAMIGAGVAVVSD